MKSNTLGLVNVRLAHTLSHFMSQITTILTTLLLIQLELLVEELSGKFELVQKRATGETASMEQDHREDDNQRKGKGRAS